MLVICVWDVIDKLLGIIWETMVPWKETLLSPTSTQFAHIGIVAALSITFWSLPQLGTTRGPKKHTGKKTHRIIGPTVFSVFPYFFLISSLYVLGFPVVFLVFFLCVCVFFGP